MRLDFLNRNLFNLSFGQSHNFGDILNRLNSVKNAAFLILSIFVLNLSFIEITNAQTTCTGNVPIQNLANGMNYTITVGPTSGNVAISVTVVDNPPGLVGFLGGPGNPISFPNGSGTFTYNLTGQPNPYVLNIYFNWAAGGQGSSTPVSCSATVSTPLALPIVFDSQPATLTPFGSNMSATIGVDPTDPTNAVLCATKLPGADCWAGVTVGSPICLASPIDFASGTTITMDVYSPVAGAPILLKLENCTNATISTEIVVLTTVTNAWETLTFNFGTSGCAAPPNLANTYDKLSIFPNFTCTPTACGVPNPGVGSTFSSSAFYFDNIELVPTPIALELPIVFDSQPATLTPFGGNMSATIGVDPTDPTNAVLCATKLPGADCWAGVTVGSPICLAAPIDFASGTTITMDVYSPVAGAPILLKLENCITPGISTEIVVLTTVANAWETLTFNFGTSGCPAPPNLANTYDKLSIFPNFTCTPTACGVPNPGVGSTFSSSAFYFDNIELVPTPIALELPIVFDSQPATLTPFGGNMSATIGVDPTDPTNAVLCATKLPGADCWAGVTVGSPICLASPIDFASGTTITMDVYSPVAGAPILLKLENCTNPGISTEIVVLTTVANAWETLTFNFGTSGCPAPPNLANTYDKLSIFPNFTCTPTACGVPNPGASSTFVAAPFYFDNIQLKIPQCSGSGAITGLGAPQVPNGYTYTIVENGSGNTTISITVIDNPVGLVGFLGGPGGIMAIANATGTLTWTVASNTLTNPINVFFAWAGNNGMAVPIPYIAGDCLCTATVAAPIPTCAPANVISMFSNTYPNVPVNTWRTPWSAATLTDIQIAGNDTKLYTNLDFVGIETVGPNLMNLTNMTYMHIDVWTPNMTTIRVKLVDFGPNRNFAGGDDSEHEVVLNCSVQCGWNSFHIPLSGFANLRSRAQIAQLILSGLPTGQGTLYVDNVYFTTCAPTAGMQIPATISITETSGLLNNDGIICAGATATLTASGGGTYAWSTGATTAAITTSTAGTYTVTVTNAGCAFSVSQFITVIPLPVASIARVETSGITPNDGIICQGAMATLTASGGGTYVWSNGATTAGITTGTAGTYSVTVTSVNGCTAATSSSITVLPLPTPSISVSETSGTVANDGTIYTGSSANLTASGGGTYLWNTGATTAGITVTPSTTTTYTVTVTNANNCSATASTTITVIDPSCLLVCSGDQTITLTNGACEYQLPNLVTGAGVCDFFTIEQVSGPEPGDLLPRGSYDITYQLVSNLGEIIDECTFTVVVRANPVVVNSLTCNNHINISADINCEVTLSPDMFLEGNSYSCYADYQINIWPFNSQANAINNVPQNEGINLPTGEHTYEIVGPSGNRCWGTFTIEDKLAPVVECNCSGPVADVSAFREIGVFGNKKYYLSNATYTWQQAYAHAQSVGGEMLCITSAAENAFILNTWSIPGFASQRTWLGATDNEAYGGTEANNTNNGWVWVSGEPFSYTNWASGEPNGLANEDYVEMFGTGGTEPGRWNDNTNTFGPLRYIMEVENCSYNCYDLAVIQNETVPMLYGVSPNKSVLTTPPTATDGCGPVSATFTDAINGGDQCDTRELVRSWTFEDASGNKSYCTQRFAFEPISVTDLIPPVREVHLTCGLDATPAAIAGYLDVDSRTQLASATNIGAYADDYAQTGSVVELHEGYANGYFTYNQIGYDGRLHAQKVDNNVCNLYTTYTDDVIPACGIGCSGNMKVIRNWKLLDWCTGEVYTYTQVIKATDEKAPTFTVKNATVGVDPWGCAANWNVGQPWELADNCAKAEEIKWGVKVPSGVTLSGTAPNYRITGLTKGTHKITYWASDCCGNVSEKDAYVTVIDASAPVAVAKQNIVMSLTGSGTGADGAGKIYGWQIDNGSYDHCSDVRFEVRRVDGGSCGNVGANGTHNNNSTYNDNNGYPSEYRRSVVPHPQDNAQDTDGGLLLNSVVMIFQQEQTMAYMM
ncbi:MAG: hypothetical protein IPO48_17290 [Saprospiraceae bacterium]|nr:hypothetical protein [Saprospiraceae bacterium]